MTDVADRKQIYLALTIAVLAVLAYGALMASPMGPTAYTLLMMGGGIILMFPFSAVINQWPNAGFVGWGILLSLLAIAILASVAVTSPRKEQAQGLAQVLTGVCLIGLFVQITFDAGCRTQQSMSSSSCKTWVLPSAGTK